MPEAGLSATIVFPLFNFVLRAIQTGYEIAAVPSETSDHLKTISQVLLDLKTARTLRREKAAFLSDDDLVRIDTVVKNTEDALMALECLVERARVDMSLHQNSVRAHSRLMWVMRDSNKVTAALSRLTVVSQSLHSEIIAMRLAGNTSYQDGYGQRPPPKYSYSSPASVSYSSPQPHLHATMEACADRREWTKRRHSVKRTEPVQDAPNPMYIPSRRSRADLLGDDAPLSPSINNVAEYIRENEAILSTIGPTLSVARRGELTPARVVEPDLNDEVTFPAPSGISEIDSGIPLQTSPTPRPYAFSTPNLPYTSPETPFTSHNINTRHRRQSLSPTIPERPTSQSPRPDLTTGTSTNGLNSRVVIRGSGSNTMQSTAVVLGSRIPRAIVWDEPLNEESEEGNLQPNADINTASNDHDPPPAYRSLTGTHSSVGSIRQPLNSTRRSTRRRPMVYPAAEPIPEPPTVPIVPVPETAPTMNIPIIASGESVGRNVRVRHSRLGYALDEHNREVGRVIARNSA